MYKKLIFTRSLKKLYIQLFPFLYMLFPQKRELEWQKNRHSRRSGNLQGKLQRESILSLVSMDSLFHSKAGIRMTKKPSFPQKRESTLSLVALDFHSKAGIRMTKKPSFPQKRESTLSLVALDSLFHSKAGIRMTK